MPRRILPLLLLSTMLALVQAGPVQARVMVAHIAKVTTGVATLHDVQVRLEWPANAIEGQLVIQARRVVAPDLGYRFERLAWRCPLQRSWRCEGQIRSAGRVPLRLSVDLASATTDAELSQGSAHLSLHRNVASPDLTRIDLARVPLLWAQALLAQGWADAGLKTGVMSGSLDVDVPVAGPLRVDGRLDVSQLALDTPDGAIAAENLGAQLEIDYRRFATKTLVTVDGQLRGGELLVGNGYIALPPTPVQLSVTASQDAGAGWQLAQLRWDDGDSLRVAGSVEFDNAGNLSGADLQLDSANLAPLRPRYLSGWLGQLGLGEMQLAGAMSAHMQVSDTGLQQAELKLREVSLVDARQRFRIDSLNGDPAFSSSGPTNSRLQWGGGQLMGIEFGAVNLPLHSAQGRLALTEVVSVPMLGGSLRLENLGLRPPANGRGMQIETGLTLQGLDVGMLAKAMDWPAFEGRLAGRIPQMRYADDRLDFDGGLTAQMFEGTVQVSGLAMERPFGTAPTLSADIVFDDMDLQSLTGVFGFGEITGALDGSIRQLRLVDWTAQAFDAELHTDLSWQGRQRISQRAVQDLSSVGGTGGGLGNSVQAQALKLFDDFRYRQIGIRCTLANDVCEMDGLGSAGKGFIIVRGSGLPRLNVVGFNRRVDWPTLVERLVAVTQGDTTPVIE